MLYPMPYAHTHSALTFTRAIALSGSECLDMRYGMPHACYSMRERPISHCGISCEVGQPAMAIVCLRAYACELRPGVVCLGSRCRHPCERT